MTSEAGWESRIGRRLRLRDLHFLIAVVRAGSMMKAATQLGVSQPVVSEAIADLESTVGVRLLDRGPRGVEPTLYGQALISRSQIAFDELRQGIRDIEFLADPTTGEVRIGCPETLAAGVLSPIIDELSRRSPRVRFQVALVSFHHRLEFPELRERKLDLILERDHEASGESEYAKDLDVEKLFDEHLLVVAGVTSPWARRRKISLAELADAPWILPANSWNWWCVEEAFAAIGKNMPNAMVDTVSVALREQLLATGRFVAAIPASTLRSNIHKGLLKVLPVALPNKPWPVVMVTLKHRTLSPAVQQFVELARVRSRAHAQINKSEAF